MRNFIKRLIPKNILSLIRKHRLNKKIIRAYNIDRLRFQKSAFELVKTPNEENMEARIIFNYHSLEKGLSNINFREGFGERAYTQLIITMNEYIKYGFDKNSIPFQTGLSVLKEYLNRHKDTKVDLSFVQSNFTLLSAETQFDDFGGVLFLNKDYIISKSKNDFKSLALNRFSVRDFSAKQIDLELLNQALEIASKTPSVCNRQPWHSHVIRNKVLIDQVLSIQKGFKGYGKNIDSLILICSNNNFLSSYTERNQGFTDAGMFSMSLIYSLQYLGLATCALNANLPVEQDMEIRKLLRITENQNLVMFIAVGNYEEEFLVPKSKRYDIEKKTSYYK